jgi:hypothetical protein
LSEIEVPRRCDLAVGRAALALSVGTLLAISASSARFDPQPGEEGRAKCISSSIAARLVTITTVRAARGARGTWPSPC